MNEKKGEVKLIPHSFLLMSRNIKLGLYVVFAIATLWSGFNFFSRLKQSSHPAPETNAETNEVVQAPATNAAEPGTNLVAATDPAATNTAPAATNGLATTDTNAPAEVTATVTNEPPAAAPADNTETAVKSGKVKSAAGVIGAMVKFAAALICLGGLIAYDISQYFGNRALDLIYNDDLKGVKDPEYEQAEQAWANGKALDAIQMMREYLRKNPREQHVALRIAEIYEKDLNNPLAAALEYEQVLKHNLERERWGWAAIHLCNLYSRLGKSNETVALLRRIAEEYSETAAAKKARKRLAMFEAAGDATSLGVDMPEDASAPAIPAPPPKAGPIRVEVKKKEAPAPEEPPSNLPPGFRPKK